MSLTVSTIFAITRGDGLGWCDVPGLRFAMMLFLAMPVTISTEDSTDTTSSASCTSSTDDLLVLDLLEVV
jgi:hypothetical protein